MKKFPPHRESFIPRCRYPETALLVVVGCLSLIGKHAYAAGDLPGYHLREEIIAQKGVLISQPNPFDREITCIIETNNIRSLEDYSQWLKSNIRFKHDSRVDIWAEPQETLRKRQGDCEDFAFLNREVLNGLGYRPRLLALIKKGEAHAICVFKEDGYYMWFDNATLKKTEAKTIRELAQWLTEISDYVQLAELDTQRNRWHILYRKS